MILSVSIIDLHRIAGDRHVGTYCFEVPIDMNASHYEAQVLLCPFENEDRARTQTPLGRLLSKEDIISTSGAVDGTGRKL